VTETKNNLKNGQALPFSLAQKAVYSLHTVDEPFTCTEKKRILYLSKSPLNYGIETFQILAPEVLYSWEALSPGLTKMVGHSCLNKEKLLVKRHA
jgi:hypothetical protein